jgi:hypothetical protein
MSENPANIDRTKWDEDARLMEESASEIPADKLHKFPELEVMAKDGEVLKVSGYYFHFTFSYNPTRRVCSSDAEQDAIIRVFVRNSKGEIIATRNGILYAMINELSSEIKVRDRGKGYARPVDEAFMAELQWLSDELKRSFTWILRNSNLERLMDYNASADRDPKVLESLEEEQKRWLALYGEGGKLGFVKGRKVFNPNVKNVEAIAQEVKRRTNEIS